MKILFDLNIKDGAFVLASQWIDLSPTAPAEIETPLRPGVKLRPIDAIALIACDKAKLQQAGYLEPTNIPGHPVGTTRWQIIVAEANKPTAIPEVQALQLKDVL